MKYTYIKFEAPKSETSFQKEHFAKKIIENIMEKTASSVFPKANPDFDKEIDHVKEWLVEYDIQNNFSNREVGLNSLGQAIIIMPWENNYGYWTDIDIKLDYFVSQLKATIIDKDQFELYWKQFEESH